MFDWQIEIRNRIESFAASVEESLSKQIGFCGCRIPYVFRTSDEFWCIEMEIVSPPFVLDFAGADLNIPPEYPDDVVAAWEVEKREQYEDDWPWVRQIMAELAGIGVYLADVKPGNITLR